MKTVLRIIALWFGFAVLVMALLLAHLPAAGVRWTTKAALACIVLLGFAVLGAFAAVQLWRLRESGRRAAIGICLVAILLVFAQFGSWGAGEVARVGVTGLVLLLLLSPAARRACTPAPQ